VLAQRGQLQMDRCVSDSHGLRISGIEPGSRATGRATVSQSPTLDLIAGPLTADAHQAARLLSFQFHVNETADRTD
jgi:hypothetical protein